MRESVILWRQTKLSKPKDDKQILLRLKYKNSPTLVICGYYSNNIFYCLETKEDLSDANILEWCNIPEN